MKLQVLFEGETKNVELNEVDGNFVVEIEGESRSYDVSYPEPGIVLLKSEGHVYEATVGELGADVAVSLRNSEFQLSVYDPKDLRATAGAEGAADGTVELISAMPGKVVDVLVEEGAEVSAGEGVLVVEAMKMQNELKSPKDGTVTSIKVSNDDRVNAGDVLAVIE